MSIASSIYAEYANKVKNDWAKRLAEINNSNALNEQQKFMHLWTLIDEIERFEFGE